MSVESDIKYLESEVPGYTPPQAPTAAPRVAPKPRASPSPAPLPGPVPLIEPQRAGFLGLSGPIWITGILIAVGLAYQKPIRKAIT